MVNQTISKEKLIYITRYNFAKTRKPCLVLWRCFLSRKCSQHSLHHCTVHLWEGVHCVSPHLLVHAIGRVGHRNSHLGNLAAVVVLVVKEDHVLQNHTALFQNALKVSRLRVLRYLHRTVEDVLHWNVCDAVIVVHHNAKLGQKPPAAANRDVVAPSLQQQRCCCADGRDSKRHVLIVHDDLVTLCLLISVCLSLFCNRICWFQSRSACPVAHRACRVQALPLLCQSCLHCCHGGAVGLHCFRQRQR